ncbi:MAG: aminoacyl-tRNA hydrolase [Tetrasphaera sp.]|jgi:ribosome-associated protein|nr:aminoacyl-tRNA hydrolase [Tetrasphaera sp.]
MDLTIPAGPGVPAGVIIPESELTERFSRSSGPGGQGVNTADSRVELEFDIAASECLTPAQRRRALAVLGTRLVDARLVVTASEHRSQRRNRVAARDRMATLLRDALVPPPPPRRPTRPTRSSQLRRLDAKRKRARTKADRARPDPE